MKIKNRELYIKFFIFLYFIILHDYHGHFLKLQEERGQVGSMAMVVEAGPQWFASDQMDWWRNISSVGVNRTLRGYPRPAIPNPADKKIAFWFLNKILSTSVPDPYHLIRIRHFRLNPDPGFWCPKMERNWYVKKNLILFYQKLQFTIYISLGLHHKKRPSCRRSLQHSKENLQHFKTLNFWIFSVFVGHFCPPASGYGSTEPGSNPDPEHCCRQRWIETIGSPFLKLEW